MLKLTFLGATDTVTGSKYLVETEHSTILVDCGMFQGVKNLRERNWRPLPLAVHKLDAIVVTHAHIDHSGYLPVMMKQGYRGPIYTSAGTQELCKVLLPDAGYLQEEDARYANKHRYSKHSPAEPLYTESEGRKVLEQFRSVPFKQSVYIKDIILQLSPVGHILGAAAATLTKDKTRLGFSGDVGRFNDPVLHDPEALAAVDYLVVESTYGDRLHPVCDVEQEMTTIINETATKGGIILIPSFAVGRAQLLLYLIKNLRKAKKIPPLPVYLNSPMAISATEIYERFHRHHKLSNQDCHEIDQMTTYVRDVKDSIALNERNFPAIIISASGMASGGRVLHHLKKLVSNHRNTILFAGYQAPGTRGDALVNGADQIKIHGEYFPVRATIRNFDFLSAHGDYQEILKWLKCIPEAPRKTFVIHGEPRASDSMRRYIIEQLGWDACVPQYRDEFLL